MRAEQLTALASAARAAVRCEAATGVPALLTVAQWALESGWGAHAPGNNCFGIKAYEGCAGRQQLMTIEYVHGKPRSLPQSFATFPSLFDCFERHATLIAQGAPYAKPFAQYREDRDFAAFVAGIGRVYATDPGYARLILQLAAQTELRAAVEAARAAEEAPTQIA